MMPRSYWLFLGLFVTVNACGTRKHEEAVRLAGTLDFIRESASSARAKYGDALTGARQWIAVAQNGTMAARSEPNPPAELSARLGQLDSLVQRVAPMDLRIARTLRESLDRYVISVEELEAARSAARADSTAWAASRPPLTQY
ncbi:MAG: hypothetical protein ABI141_09120 [Gemmatimonadaceae bacterium]